MPSHGIDERDRVLDGPLGQNVANGIEHETTAEAKWPYLLPDFDQRACWLAQATQWMRQATLGPRLVLFAVGTLTAGLCIKIVTGDDGGDEGGR